MAEQHQSEPTDIVRRQRLLSRGIRFGETQGWRMLLAGILLGVALMLFWWPRLPTGTARPQPADVQVTVSDSYLARAVQRRVGGLAVPQIRHVTVRSSPPSILLVSADLGLGPLAAPTDLELRPVAESGRVHVHVVQASIAGVPVPSQLVGALEDAIDASAAQIGGSNARVSSVVVTPGGLEIFVNYPAP